MSSAFYPLIITFQSRCKLRRLSIVLLCGLGLSDIGAWAQARPKSLPSENKVLGCILEPMPEYRDGGEAGLRRFITQNLRYPSGQQKSGKVFISFVVTKQGYARSFAILKGMGEPFDTEALRVAKFMGKWIPVKDDVHFTLPITFSNNSQPTTQSTEK